MQTLTSNPLPGEVYRARSTNWTSVRLVNIYRFGLASIFFAQSFISPSPLLNIRDLTLYSWVSFAFLILSLVWIVAASIERRGFHRQVHLQIYGDIIIIILLMHACGGITSGLGMLLIISIAISGLLTEQALAILFASLASLGLLAQHIYSVKHLPVYAGSSTQVGILGASLIATAIVTHRLIMRVRSGEQLIQQRERDIALLSSMNQEIIENMQAGVIVLNRNDQIRHINRAALEMLHLERHKSLSLHRDCPEIESALDSWRESTLQDTPPVIYNTGVGNLQISFRQLQSAGQPNTMIFLNDISSIQDSMQQAKLASLGHLTASIAHEIRNPLGAISYASELLNESEDLVEGDQRMLEIINQHTLRINHIIEDILKISRGSATTREPIELENWLPRFIDGYCQSGLASPESFILQIESEQATTLFDAGHLGQILTNLCNNARIHGDADKPVTIRVFVDDIRHLCIEVADQGPGLSPEARDRLFDPFYTTSHEGSGLGLYIVSQLCDLNNATISARGNNNNGTSFIMRMASQVTRPELQKIS